MVDWTRTPADMLKWMAGETGSNSPLPVYYNPAEGWGLVPWGFREFGFGPVKVIADPTLPPPVYYEPVIIYKSPAPNQTNVAEDAIVHIQFSHAEHILDIRTPRIYLNDVLVYSGATGFQANVVGTAKSVAGVRILQIHYLPGFSYNERVSVRAYATDFRGVSVDSTWYFQVREDPRYYGGLSALPVELRLQKPYQYFLGLEPVRQRMLSLALAPQPAYIAEAGNKAARVLYQLAYATELSSLLNRYDLQDPSALVTLVREKENRVVLDAAMMSYRDQIERGLEDFIKLKLFDSAYMTSFAEYLNSSSYLYRMSLLANMLFFAAAYELQYA
jgi:hypothetical protein